MTRLQVIVLSYNRPNFLRTALRSILAQSISDFQLMVLDNASDFDVQQVVREVGGERVAVTRNACNIGVLANFVKALDMAQAEHVVVFHDDDCMAPRMLERQLELFRLLPDLSFVSTGVNFVYDESRVFVFPRGDDFSYEVFDSAPELLQAFLMGKAFGFGSVMYRTAHVRRIAPDVDRFANVVDRPYLLALAAQGRCARLIAPTYNARVHVNQDSGERKWSHLHELELGRYYLEIGHPGGNRKLRSAVTRLLVQALCVRRPRVDLRRWLRDVRARDLLFWGPLLRYTVYFALRSKILAVAARLTRGNPSRFRTGFRRRQVEE